jgi:hypothetical protein
MKAELSEPIADFENTRYRDRFPNGPINAWNLNQIGPFGERILHRKRACPLSPFHGFLHLKIGPPIKEAKIHASMVLCTLTIAF